MFSILCWNIRGVRSRGTLPYLKNTIRLNTPDIVALLEPMADSELGSTIMRTLGYDHFIHGGDTNKKIWLFWKSHIQLQLSSVTDQYLHCNITDSNMQSDLNCTFVYAKCRKTERNVLWEGLTQIADSTNAPWIVGGDFNTIAHYSEKTGGSGFDEGAIRDFNSFIMRAGLSDPGFNGNSFTWSNNRSGNHCIWERLDRVLFNGWFLNRFQIPKVSHLARAFSDHCPLLISIDEETRKPSRFHYLKMWESHPSFKATVQEAWLSPSHRNPLLNFSLKLQHVRKILRKWNWQVFGDLRRKESNLLTRITTLENAMQDNAHPGTERDLWSVRKELEDILITQDNMLRDKARANWFQDGDRNSAFFHASVRARRAPYKAMISIDGGHQTNNPDDIGRAAVQHYQSLYSSRTPPLPTTVQLASLAPLVAAPTRTS